MPDVPGDELYCHLPLHAPRQPDHRPVAAEDRPELPYGAVLADLFRRPRSAECLWICCGKKESTEIDISNQKMYNYVITNYSKGQSYAKGSIW
mgnify:CR=1 FL=1